MHTMIILPDMPQALFVVHQKCYLSNSAKAVMILNGSTRTGDTGQQYFSIVYMDGLQNQWLFYADYIIMKKNGTVWVIETKGGESKGKDKNTDIQIENKFNVFKNYAAEHSLHWGFVRDKDNQLYINNTEFAHDMADEHWGPLSQEF